MFLKNLGSSPEYALKLPHALPCNTTLSIFRSRTHRFLPYHARPIPNEPLNVDEYHSYIYFRICTIIPSQNALLTPVSAREAQGLEVGRYDTTS
jgi:hypothetical protein